jgi:galactokinase
MAARDRGDRACNDGGVVDPTLQPDDGDALLAQADSLHEATFHAVARHAGHAPGRVNLIGEHVDYCGGLVLPMAIDRRTVVVAAACDQPVVCAVSDAALDDAITVAWGDVATLKGWGAYVAGVAEIMRCEGLLAGIDGVTLAVASDVPLGAGLSSSASLEVATVMALLALSGHQRSPEDVVRIARRAEHEFAGVPCGIMDQSISVKGLAGRALLLDCLDGSARQVPLPRGLAVVVADTGVSHALASGEYALRRASCERALAAVNAGRASPLAALRQATAAEVEAASMDEVDRRRARHVVEECDRVAWFAAAMEAGDLATCGILMNRSHESLRVLHEVSCPELDRLASAARSCEGVFGARMTGGGFGGSIVALVAEALAEAVVGALLTAGATSAFVTHAAAGARGERIRPDRVRRKDESGS